MASQTIHRSTVLCKREKLDSKIQIKFKQEKINKGRLLMGKNPLIKWNKTLPVCTRAAIAHLKSSFIEMKKGYASEHVSSRQVIVSFHKLMYLQ